MSPRYYIGTSGWHYDHWKGIFYPEDLPKSEWLNFYSKHFNTVELNYPFYRLPTENAFQNWRDSSPPRFKFAVKASRFITHIKRLVEATQPTATFMQRAKVLHDKLGPILYQLPPNMQVNEERLEQFLQILPKNICHAFEFRHESWLAESVYQIMRKYGVGLCIFDMPGFMCPLKATADFAYIRFHGSAALYSSRYSDREMADWAKRISNLAGSKKLKDVYIYFNNDAEAYAIENAKTISNHLNRK